jgi:hypothetical protein
MKGLQRLGALSSLALSIAAGCGESASQSAAGIAPPDASLGTAGRGGGEGGLEDADSPPTTDPIPNSDDAGRTPTDGGSDAGRADAICLEFSAPVAIGTIEEPALDQLSGFVASRSQPGVLFAHEDSTGAPIVYALTLDGRSLATFDLTGAPNTDWEDIALGPGPDGTSQLFIGDIGDNPVRTGGAPRPEIQVIRLAEPVVASSATPFAGTLSAYDVLRFTYPSGVHESETLMVDPRSGDILIVTRSTLGDSRVFRAPGSTPPDTPTLLEEIGRITLPTTGQAAIATAGDISPSGDRILVRTYTDVYLWPAPAGMALRVVFEQQPRVLPWAIEPQGEAISFAADGHAWVSAGEQDATLYRAAENCL